MKHRKLLRTPLRVLVALLAGVAAMLISFTLGDASQFDTVPVPLPVYLVGGALWCGAPLWGLLAGTLMYRALARAHWKGD